MMEFVSWDDYSTPLNIFWWLVSYGKIKVMFQSPQTIDPWPHHPSSVLPLCFPGALLPDTQDTIGSTRGLMFHGATVLEPMVTTCYYRIYSTPPKKMTEQ
jgi:hypothetical protein